MDTKVVKTVCPRDCPDVCNFLTYVKDGRVEKVVADPSHPITQGFMCGKCSKYENWINHADRLLYPLAREKKTDEFRRVSWDEALELVTKQFKEIVARQGGSGILPYSYLANLGIVATRFADRLWNKMNTSRVGMEICAMGGVEAMVRVVGLVRGTEPQHLTKTKLYIAWGRNPKETSVHMWKLVRDIHPRVVIDPFKSDSALDADLHVQPKPGTDSMLAIGLMRILIEKEWIDEAFIKERTTGFEALKRRVLSTELDEVDRITGVPRAQLIELARLYHEYQPGLINIGVGLQRNVNGGEMVAAVCMLGALTGQIGVPGGGVLYANFDWRLNDISYGHLRTDGPYMHNMIKLGRDLTQDDQIKALYVYDQNPAATCPNQNLVHKGLAREDLFVVVHDLFMTDTAQFANVVLPATSFVESTDLHLSYWHDYVQISNQAIPPMGEARSNYWVFREIARNMDYTEPCFYQTEEEVMAEALNGTGITVEELKKNPVLWNDPSRTSFDDGHFPTPSGKIELFAPGYTPFEPSAAHRYRFITPKTKRLEGSQVFNMPEKLGELKIPFVFIHPKDAARESIETGAPVRLWNERGEVELIAEVSERVQEGVVVSYMVRWGDNANATTSDVAADMGGNSTFHSNYVSLAPRAAVKTVSR